MLTGSKPFDRPTPIATALAHVQEEAPQLPPGTPAELISLVGDCLAKDPDQRPTAAFIVDLVDPQAALPEAVEAPAQEQTAFMGPLPRRASLD